MLRLSREGRASGGAERTLCCYLVSQYREHEKLFRNANCKKKSVWELITASMATENPNFIAQPEQVEGKWKSLTLVTCLSLLKLLSDKNCADIFVLQTACALE